MGTCNYNTGTCTCHPGFEGAACERSSCPTDALGNVCSGHGECLSMAEAAKRTRRNGVLTPISYGGINMTNSTAWDAHKIFGCVCESNGYQLPGELANISGEGGCFSCVTTCARDLSYRNIHPLYHLRLPRRRRRQRRLDWLRLFASHVPDRHQAK